MNDREWLQATLQRYEAPLIHYAARVCGGIEPARDAVQETFLELCSCDRRDVEGRIAAWLFTVCRNKALDVRRRNGAMPIEDDMTALAHAKSEAEPSAAAARGEEGARVFALLARLPAKQQEVVRLKFQGGLSYREIAGVTGESIGNVGFLLHVALRSLRERLAPRTSPGQTSAANAERGA